MGARERETHSKKEDVMWELLYWLDQAIRLDSEERLQSDYAPPREPGQGRCCHDRSAQRTLLPPASGMSRVAAAGYTQPTQSSTLHLIVPSGVLNL